MKMEMGVGTVLPALPSMPDRDRPNFGWSCAIIPPPSMHFYIYIQNLLVKGLKKV